MKNKNIKKLKQFHTRIDSKIYKKVDDKRKANRLKWNSLIDWLFNYYLEKL